MLPPPRLPERRSSTESSLDYIAFEDEHGEVRKMATVRSGNLLPGLPGPFVAAAPVVPVDDPITLTRPFDLENGSSSTTTPEEPETLPHRPVDDGPTEDHTSATIRRPTLPPPALPPPPATVPGDALQLVGDGRESEVTPIVHTGTLPWITQLPKVDSTPPPAMAIPTPLTMITEREDNLTRIAPLAPRPQLGPIPYAHAPAPAPGTPAAPTPPRRIALGLTAVALAAVLGFVAVRPHVQTSSAPASAPAPQPVVEPAPPPIRPPPVAAPTPTPAAVMLPASLPSAGLASTPTTAPATAPRIAPRSEGRRTPAVHHPPARPVRPASFIPVRREQ